ncbi:MAG: zinc ribbon domain-containing protein, partial [Actinomycetota bacterium]
MEPSQESLLDLLELQKIDSTIDRLEARRRALPEQMALEALEEELSIVDKRMAEERSIYEEISSRQMKLETDIETIAAKSASEEKKLNSGDVANPRELAGLQAEIESLNRRRSDLEDRDLEVMQEKENAEAALKVSSDEGEALKERIGKATEQRDEAMVEIAADLQQAREQRQVWVPKFDKELLDFYDDLRASKGGIAATALIGSTCQGCHMQLPAQEVDSVRKTKGLARCV